MSANTDSLDPRFVDILAALDELIELEGSFKGTVVEKVQVKAALGALILHRLVEWRIVTRQKVLLLPAELPLAPVADVAGMPVSPPTQEPEPTPVPAPVADRTPDPPQKPRLLSSWNVPLVFAGSSEPEERVVNLQRYTPFGLTEPWEYELFRMLPEFLPQSGDVDEFNRLREVLKRGGGWNHWGDPPFVALLSYLAARFRQIQKGYPLIDGFSEVFSVMSSYPKGRHGAFVYGLASACALSTDDWGKNANQHLSTLLDCLSDVDVNLTVVLQELRPWIEAWQNAKKKSPEKRLALERLKLLVRYAVKAGISDRPPFVQTVAVLKDHLGEFKTLRQRVRDLGKTQSQIPPEEESEAAIEIPEDWPHFAMTQGKRVIIFGGTPVPEARQRILEAFGFNEIVWRDAEFKGSLIESVRQSISSGGVALVLMLRRLIGHNSKKIVDACKASGTPIAYVDGSYSVGRVKFAIEHYLKDTPLPTEK